jgi:hypothetical protein
MQSVVNESSKIGPEIRPSFLVSLDFQTAHAINQVQFSPFNGRLAIYSKGQLLDINHLAQNIWVPGFNQVATEVLVAILAAATESRFELVQKAGINTENYHKTANVNKGVLQKSDLSLVTLVRHKEATGELALFAGDRALQIHAKYKDLVPGISPVAAITIFRLFCVLMNHRAISIKYLP